MELEKSREEIIRDLLEKRDKMLLLNPKLHILQMDIEKAIMDAGDDPDKRAAAVFNMLVNHINNKLIPALESTLSLCDEANSRALREMRGNLEISERAVS